MSEGFRKIVGIVCVMMFLGTIFTGVVFVHPQENVSAEISENIEEQSAKGVKGAKGQTLQQIQTAIETAVLSLMPEPISLAITLVENAPNIYVVALGGELRDVNDKIMELLMYDPNSVEAGRLMELADTIRMRMNGVQHSGSGGGSGNHGGSAAGGDGADDNYDVSTPVVREKNTFNALMRLASKKNMTYALLVKDEALTSWEIYDISPVLREKNYTYLDIVKADDELQRTPDVAVLLNGYYDYFATLLSEFDEPISFVDTDLVLSDWRKGNISISMDDANFVNDHPVLVIPSGGLYGLDSSPTFKSNLEKYVSNGGTLIVFSQQRGIDYKAVPGNISAFGWIEDGSCQHASAGISAYHPIFSGQTSATPNFNVDGYFTEYPDDATILLTRTKNGQPAMLMYNYGKGSVVASTLYEDYAYGHYACGADGKKLVRDMIAWAKEPKDISGYAPGDAITIPITAINNAHFTASKVVFTVIDPDKNVIDTVEVSETVASGETKTVDFTYTAPSTYGIWWIDYALKDNSDNIIYQMFDAQRFAVAKYKENPDGFIYQGEKITFSIVTESEYYLYSGDGRFTIFIWNNYDVDKNITVEYWFPHNYWATYDPQYGGDWRDTYLHLKKTVTVPAYGSANFTHILKNIHTADSLRADFYDDGKYLGHGYSTFRMVTPSIEVNVNVDKEVYNEGEEISSTISYQSDIDLASAYITINVMDSSENIVLTEEYISSLTANVAKTDYFNFTLPSISMSGDYLVYASVESGKQVGGGSAGFRYYGGNGTLYGKIMDLFTNTPIADATVTVEGIEKYSTVSDTNGSYSIEVPGSYYSVEVTAEGYNTGRTNAAVYPYTENEKNLYTTPTTSNISFIGSQMLAGKVYTLMGNEPISNATVFVNLTTNEITTVTDENGEYSIILPAGSYSVRVQLADTTSTPTTGIVYSGKTTTLDLYIDAAIQDGTVLDLVYETPIPNATIVFDDATTVTTDSSGYYSIPLTLGHHTVSVTATNYSSVTTSIHVSYRTSEQNFYLIPTTNVTTGYVRDLIYNTTISNANVSFDGTYNVTTNSDGFYWVVLPTGHHSVNVEAENYESVTTSIYVAERSTDYDFYLKPTINWTVGVVRDLIYNTPIPGANISFDGEYNTTTDLDGSYSIILSTGYHTVTVNETSYKLLTTSIYVAQRSSNYDFYLQPPATNMSYVNGTVRDLVYNLSLSSVSLTFDVGTEDEKTVQTDEMGFYSTILPTDYHTVTLSLENYEEISTSIHVAGRTSDYDFYLMPITRTFTGTVRDLNETTTIAGADLSFDGITNVTTDGTGVYTVTLFTGYHSVSVSKSGYDTLTTSIHVSARNNNIDFLLTSSGYTPPETKGNLTGHVYDVVTNEPIEGVWIDWSGHSGPYTDANGSYTWTDMNIGDVKLRAVKSGYEQIGWYYPKVYPGRTNTIDFYMKPLKGSIKGYVYDVVTNEPIEGVWIDWSGHSGPYTDANGSYTWTDMNIGDVKLRAVKSGYEQIGWYYPKVYPGRTNTIDFYMKPSPMPSTGNLTGRVCDLVTGLGLNATLIFNGEIVSTDENGTYFVTLTGGTVSVIVNSTGYDNLTAEIYVPIIRDTNYDFYLTTS